MGDDAWLAEPADDAMGQIARAFRCAAGQHEHVGLGQRAAHGGLEPGFVVGNGPEEHGLAAVLVDRGGDDRTVGIVDRSGRKNPAGLNQFVAGRDHGNPRLARDSHLGNAAGGEHADLARADDGPGAQQGLAARNVGARIRHELPRRDGAPHVDPIRARRLGVLDHDDGVGAARQRTAGRDRRCGASRHLQARRGAAVNDFAVQREMHGRAFAGRGQVGRAHGKAVNIRAVERRHVDRRRDVLGERCAQRIRKLARFTGDRARKQRRFEA